jgi:hypothetical protein
MNPLDKLCPAWTAIIIIHWRRVIRQKSLPNYTRPYQNTTTQSEN